MGSITVIKHWSKATWGWKDLFYLVADHLSRKIRAETKGRNLEERIDPEALGGVLLTGIFLIVCSVYFLICPKASWPGLALSIMDWVLPHQSLMKNVHHRVVNRPWSIHIASTYCCEEWLPKSWQQFSYNMISLDYSLQSQWRRLNSLPYSALLTIENTLNNIWKHLIHKRFTTATIFFSLLQRLTLQELYFPLLCSGLLVNGLIISASELFVHLE